ncbi:hypothetical protein Hanom_Chr14g01327481 [Helianthus anomalus]
MLFYFILFFCTWYSLLYQLVFHNSIIYIIRRIYLGLHKWNKLANIDWLAFSFTCFDGEIKEWEEGTVTTGGDSEESVRIMYFSNIGH